MSRSAGIRKLHNRATTIGREGADGLAPKSTCLAPIGGPSVTGVKALVTGCAGFIGSHLSERLIADGWRVTGVDAFTDYYSPLDKAANLDGLRFEPRFDLVAGDLATLDLARLLVDRPVVFHLAAQPGVRGSFGSGFDRYVHDNVIATQRVFEAALEARCDRVVYASSSSVYGDAERYPCAETTRLWPRSPYGVTKATCESLAATYTAHGLRSVGLRYFTVYGPRQRPDMAIRRLCELAVNATPFTLHGDGTQSRDFTYVTDAVDATVRAATADAPPVVNVGGGHEATMREVISIIEGLAGTALAVLSSSPQLGDVQRTGADTTEARRRLGWQPEVDLDLGIRSSYGWVLRRRHDAENLLALAAS